MNPMTDEQLDYVDEEYDGSQKMQFHQGGAIPALAEVEMIAEDDEYDDLYNDVNVGEGFLQMQQSETQMPSGSVRLGRSQAPTTNDPSSGDPTIPQVVKNSGVSNEGIYVSAPFSAPGGLAQNVDTSQKGRHPEIIRNPQVGPLGYQGSVSIPHKTAADHFGQSGNMAGDPTNSMNPHIGSSKIVSQGPDNVINPSVNINVNHSVDDDYHIRPVVGNGNTMLFVGELHWWTTDAELESVLIQYGKVKEIKFFDERASGKSKGYCQVEFHDPAAAAVCKQGMNGHHFNGRPCAVAFATSQTIKQMGASYMNKTQSQIQSQTQGRNPLNDASGRGDGSNYPNGDTGRNLGRGGWGRGNQAPNRGQGSGHMRGRGFMGSKNMIGNAPVAGGGGAYGQGLAGPGFGGPPGMMHPHGMMGPGFDLAFMGRGAGYGGFAGPAYPGMLPPFPAVNSMGLPGVAPHINPAFFGRGMAANGMGMMGTTGMDGPHSGMWSDPNMGGWGVEEYGRGTGESSYAGEDNASEYGFGEASHDKGIRSGAVSREKEKNSERDWSSKPEKRHGEERDHDRGRYDRDQRNREEKDRYRESRHKDRETGYDDDWDRGQSTGMRSRSRATQEEDHKSRSRDADYGKRRRVPSE